MTPLDQLSAEDFEPLVGQSLAVAFPGGTLDCEVAHLKRLPPHTLRVHPPFALLLRGARNQPLAQGIYELRHPLHGRLNVFMVPIGPNGTGLGYEITFN